MCYINNYVSYYTIQILHHIYDFKISSLLVKSSEGLANDKRGIAEMEEGNRQEALWVLDQALKRGQK